MTNLDDIAAALGRTRADVEEMLSLLEELFPEGGKVGHPVEVHRQYSTERS
jgi:hypothetical protein